MAIIDCFVIDYVVHRTLSKNNYKTVRIIMLDTLQKDSSVAKFQKTQKNKVKS